MVRERALEPKKKFVASYLRSTIRSADDVVSQARAKPVSERLEMAEVWKKEGNSSITADKDYGAAMAKYEQVLGLFMHILEADIEGVPVKDLGSEAEAKLVEKMLLSVFLNLAMCLVKLEKFKDGIHACNHALEIDSASVKGFYRRALCHLGLEPRIGEVCRFAAVEDLKKAQTIDPKNKAVRTMIAKHDTSEKKSTNKPTPRERKPVKLSKADKEKQKKMFQGMFDSKTPLYDDSKTAKNQPASPSKDDEQEEEVGEQDSSFSQSVAEFGDKLKESLHEKEEYPGLKWNKDGAPVL